MVLRGGIPLTSLFDATDRIVAALPRDISDFIERFSVIDHETTRSPGAVIHHGQVQSLNDALGLDAGEFDIGIGTLSLPLVNGGLPFQLSMTRAVVTGTATGTTAPMEPAAAAWQLNIQLVDFILTLNGLQAARYVPETGTLPRHLLRDPNKGPVRIIGAATLRITRLAGGGVLVGFVDFPDPLHPSLASGGVASITVSPPNFFFGDSEVGMTIGPLLLDFSDTYSPQQVLEANQGPQWVGMLIREATVYAPRNLPIVGDLSGGIRDVLIGNPLGIQGQLELQFGRTPLDPATFQFSQEVAGLNLAVSGTGRARTVTLQGAQDADFTIHAGFVVPGPDPTWTAEWSFDGGPTTRGVTATGPVRHGSVLRVKPIEISGGVEFPQNDVTFRFVGVGEAPEIAVEIGADTFANALHVNGTIAALNTVTLTASSTAPGASTFRWELVAGDVTHDGASFALDVTGLAGERDVTVTETTQGGERRVSRIRVKIVEQGALLVGTETGVFDAAALGTVLDLSAVEATFDLSDFHARGQLNSKAEQATLNSGAAARVDVPADSFAQVTITDPGVMPVDVFDRHVQILMEFEEDRVLGWGPIKPWDVSSASGEANLQTHLLAWANRYPGADFIVIGRCDDIGTAHPNDAKVDNFNLNLAKQRAAKGRSLLTALVSGATGTVIAGTRILTRGETSEWDSETARGDVLEDDASIQPPTLPDGITEAGQSDAVGDAALALGWLIKHEEDGRHQTWANAENTDEEDLRRTYRRVDIYAVGGTPAPEARRPSSVAEVLPTLRRSWVPANGRMPAVVTPSSPEIDYRVKLVVGWDSPTVASWKDAVPALIEAEFAWSPTDLPLPDFDSQPVPVQTPTEVLTVYAKWVHDSRTEFTRVTLGIRSDGDPDGLISTDQKNLTAALALGPVLLSGVDFDNDLIGSAARVVALGAGVGLAGSILKDGSKTALIAVEAEAQTRALSDPGEDYQISLTAEYTTTLHVDVDLAILTLKTAPDAPLKIRYKDVGIEFDSSKPGWEKIGFAYPTDSLEIEDAGRWQIDGVLGELLRIVEVAMGRGSLWLELRIAVALDLGIIEVSEVIFRVIFEDGNPVPRFEIRGFVLKADIPAILKGEGRVRIEDGGVIRAGVDATIIPLEASANAAIAFDKITDPQEYVFLSIFLGVQFSTPIPLGPSGAALYGFKGLFAMNGSRNVPALPDPIQRELDWWNRPPESKYSPDHGQYAIGVGVVVGTMPDVSFCFSAAGMVVVAFPDPEVILGVDVKVIEVPDTTAKDERPAEGTITGLIVIDDEAVTVAVSAQYTIPEVLELKLPFGAYFPYSGTGTYVRIGSDGEAGRFGEPVTVTFLPSTLNVKVWSYLMIEQDGLPSLGGDPRFSFDGFSVGFGAGWGIDWSAGPIRLTASAKVLVGFGTNPMMIKGGVFYAGELDLVVVSISASAELILTYLEGGVYIEGEVCGEVDLFFFSIKGCVGVKLGTNSDAAELPPPPEPPVASISLVDRKDRIMGTAVPTSDALLANPLFDIDDQGRNTGHPPEENQTAWPDTAPVIHFKHYVKNEASGQFDIAATPTQPIWFGGNRLKYTYRIDDLRLIRKRGNLPVASLTAAAALQSVWMTTPYKAPGSDGVDNPLPSEHEGPNLKLLDWNPWTWVVNTLDGGEGTDGDPADQIGDICDPKPQPRRACVFGRAAQGRPFHGVHLRQETIAPPPYPSRFHADGRPVIRMGGRKVMGRDLQILFNSFGASIRPGAAEPLPFAHSHAGETLTTGYWFPRAERATPGGYETRPIPWEAAFDRNLARPAVRLLVCGLDTGTPDKDCIEFDGLETTGKHNVLQVRDFVFRATAQDDPMVLTDLVDTGPNPDTRGSDGTAEIRIPSRGLMIALRTPCPQLELWFMILEGEGFQVTGRTVDGRAVGPAAVKGPRDRPLTATLNDPAGIAMVLIEGASGTYLVYRICCTMGGNRPGMPDEETCERFEGLKPSGDAGDRLTHRGFTFTSVDPGASIVLRDDVDQRASPPRRGQDGNGEIRIPASGLEIALPTPCETVDLGLMVFHPEPVEAKALDAAGNLVASATAPTTQGVALRLRLTSSGQPIVQIVLSGGGFEALLFRICRSGGDGGGEICQILDVDLPREVKSVTLGDIRIETLSTAIGLRVQDGVDASTTPARSGSDGRQEIQIPDEGVRITLGTPCDRVRIKVMLFGGPMKGRAFDANGGKVATAETGAEEKVEQVLSFTGEGIVTIELFGGSNEALLYEICCLDSGAVIGTAGTIFTDPLRHAADSFTRIDRPDLPVVRGIKSDTLADTWGAKVIETRGRCSIVEFTPAPSAVGPWGGVQVVAPAGTRVGLVSVCGVDQVMVDAREEDEANRLDVLATLTGILMLPVEKRREVLFEPGDDYEIQVDWSWSYWRSNKDGTNSPPDAGAIDPASWTTGAAIRHHFSVADVAADTDATQDGLNEYVFDTRDVARHLTAVEPVDGRSAHFTDDPVWVHFDSGHIEDLVALYGRELKIVVRRTDPPPQSTPALLDAALAPLLGVFTWYQGPKLLEPKGYQRIADALEAAPCLPGANPGGAALEGQFDLEPRAMYDLELRAPMATNGDDPVLVSGTRFVTSRYANPREMLTAMGYGATQPLAFGPDDLILSATATLPSGALETSDSLVDAFLEDIDAGTLPLPTSQPKTYALWRLVGTTWQLEGLLLDALETLNRTTTQRTATGTEIAPRCVLASVAIGGSTFTPVRANANWTRVLLVPAAPVTLAPGKYEILINLTTRTKPVTGRRAIRHQPSMIQREGF